MSRIDRNVRKMTIFIAVTVVILSMLMESVFLIIGKWDITVLLGNLLGASVAVLNFFLMGLTVQKAVNKDEKDAAAFMKFSMTYRFIMQLAVIGVGLLVPVFNPISTMLPLLFPRIGITAGPIVGIVKNEAAESGASDG